MADVKKIEFVFPGDPIAKKRPRFARVSNGVRTYSPQATEEGRALFEVYRQLPDRWEPLDAPLSVQVVAVFSRPASHYGSGKNADKVKKSSPRSCVNKKDVDNIAKFYMDCFNKIVWCDDKQVVSLYVIKRYAATKREQPHVRIIVSEAIV